MWGYFTLQWLCEKLLENWILTRQHCTCCCRCWLLVVDRKREEKSIPLPLASPFGCICSEIRPLYHAKKLCCWMSSSTNEADSLALRFGLWKKRHACWDVGNGHMQKYITIKSIVYSNFVWNWWLIFREIVSTFPSEPKPESDHNVISIDKQKLNPVANLNLILDLNFFFSLRNCYTSLDLIVLPAKLPTARYTKHKFKYKIPIHLSYTPDISTFTVQLCVTHTVMTFHFLSGYVIIYQ